VADGVLRRCQVDADRRGRLEGVEDPARTGLHEDGRHRDVRLEAEERRAALHADVEDGHLEIAVGVVVDTLLRELAAELDPELEREVAEVTAIGVALLDDRARRCWRRFLLGGSPGVAGQRPQETTGSYHHADDPGDPAPTTTD
jgi:hypothetical protein